MKKSVIKASGLTKVYMRGTEEVYAVNGIDFDINDGDMPLSIPVHEFSIIVPGILISFWYYLICFRELNKILKKNPNG